MVPRTPLNRPLALVEMDDVAQEARLHASAHSGANRVLHRAKPAKKLTDFVREIVSPPSTCMRQVENNLAQWPSAPTSIRQPPTSCPTPSTNPQYVDDLVTQHNTWRHTEDPVIPLRRREQGAFDDATKKFNGRPEIRSRTWAMKQVRRELAAISVAVTPLRTPTLPPRSPEPRRSTSTLCRQLFPRAGSFSRHAPT